MDGEARGAMGEKVFVLDPHLRCILVGEEPVEGSGLRLKLLAGALVVNSYHKRTPCCAAVHLHHCFG